MVKYLLVIVTPILLILVWSFLRAAQNERLFGYITATREFARTSDEVRTFDPGNPVLLFIYNMIYYAVKTPVQFSGILFFVAAIGVRRTFRNYRWISITGYAILVFITYTWMTKSNLGLNRHFVTLVPLYAICMANGIHVMYRWLVKKLFPLFPDLDFRFIKFPLVLFLVVLIADFSGVWYTIWYDRGKAAFTERREAITYFNSLPPETKVFTGDAVFEVLGNIDSSRIVRGWLNDKGKGINKIKRLAKKDGKALVLVYTKQLPLLNHSGTTTFASSPNRDSHIASFFVEITKEQAERMNR